jgi:hypothetical protein
MSAALEAVMPYPEDRRSLPRRLVAGARVVATPTERPNTDRIVVAASSSLGNVSGVELISRMHADQKGMAVIVLASEGQRSPEEVMLLQNLAVVAKPSQPAFFVAPDESILTRIFRAHRAGAEKMLIAAARIADHELWVWSCEPKLYRCPVSALPPLRDMLPTEVTKFEVSESGSRLHWPQGDVDLTLESIRAVADPAFRGSQARKYRVDAQRYAKAIRTLREKHGLSQSAITGLSDRAVRRIEQGERIPHSSTLEKLAKAHGMAVSQYMSELAALSATGARGAQSATRQDLYGASAR